MNSCTFGNIKLGGYFKFKDLIWKREHGKFGVPIHLIADGHVGIPFDVKIIVTPL